MENVMTRKFGIGIVGPGMAGRPHALALQALGDRVEVRGVFRRDADKRRAFAAQYGFPESASLEAMLADPALDAVLVLTPPNAREEIVVAAARAGKHVLMEKPVERTTAAAERIVAVCEVARVRLGIVFQHRFRAGSVKLAGLLRDGALGRIATVMLNVPWWRTQEYYDEPGRGTLAQDGGGVLLTQAIHSLDLMLSLAGPVSQVAALAGTSAMHRMETEDTVGAGWRFASGAVGGFLATTALYPGGAETMTIGGERATATLSGGTLLLHWLDGRSETFGDPPGEAGGGADRMAFPFDWHKGLIADFVDAVEAGRDPQSNGRTALQVHRLIDALLRSSREGRAVEVAG
jgi:UDP-N-acetyl-2-amino-2-deoxyglucuronate dehydrogenase